MSEKDWLNLSNWRFLLAFFTHKKHPRGASIHEIKESFPLKPTLVYRPWTSLSFIILKAIGFDHLPFADDGLASNSVTFSKQGRLMKGSKCLLSRENHNYRKWWKSSLQNFVSKNSTYSWNIKWQKCACMGLNVFHIKWIIGIHCNWKNQNPGSPFGATS